jgi:hypothetical protein
MCFRAIKSTQQNKKRLIEGIFPENYGFHVDEYSFYGSLVFDEMMFGL